jgi:carboxylesterase type B
LGNGSQNLAEIIQTNNGSFIGVSIQYRLGAFGFLSSDEVNQFGVVNAGLRDQFFALQWVQSYAHLFGGNASQVTISGESAGGGSVMLLAMAYGGSLGTSLFSNVSSRSREDI